VRLHGAAIFRRMEDFHVDCHIPNGVLVQVDQFVRNDMMARQDVATDASKIHAGLTALDDEKAYLHHHHMSPLLHLTSLGLVGCFARPLSVASCDAEHRPGGKSDRLPEPSWSHLPA